MYAREPQGPGGHVDMIGEGSRRICGQGRSRLLEEVLTREKYAPGWSMDKKKTFSQRVCRPDRSRLLDGV